jgi:hypothetical protein
MRLRSIDRVDFRKSELTNVLAMKKRSLRVGEVVCLVSSRGDQIIFAYAMSEVSEEDGTERQVLRSEKLRLTSGGSWNPMMLANYALDVGIELEGIKLFESHYKDVLDQKRVESRARRAARKRAPVIRAKAKGRARSAELKVKSRAEAKKAKKAKREKVIAASPRDIDG